MFVGLSVRPSVHIHQRGSHEKLSFKFDTGNVYESVERIQIWLKSGGKISGIWHEDPRRFYCFRRHKFVMKNFCTTPNNFVSYTVTYNSTIHRANRCSFITTMVTRTHRNVTGYVYCMYCFLLRWTSCKVRTWTSLTQKNMQKCALIYFRCYTVHVVELLNYYTNYCTYIKFIKFTH